MKALLDVVTVALCLGVMWGAVCRLRFLQTRLHKRLWVEAYFLLGVWAAGELYALVFDGPRLVSIAGLAFAGLWLLGSRSTWRDSAPSYLEK